MSLYDDINRIKEEIDRENNVILKIAFFGQPGSGKSSLINRLVNKKVADTGTRTDTTTQEHNFGWNGFSIVDLPGYDTVKFPKETYFEKFSILSFDVFICVFSEKFHKADSEFFVKLKESGKTCLFVRNKYDCLWEDGKTIDEIVEEIEIDVRNQIKSQEKVYFTSCRNNHGIGELNDGILASLDNSKKSKYIDVAKAHTIKFLNEKKKNCEKKIQLYAALSATNAINPIPGLDVSIDISVMLKLFSDLRNTFGLSDDVLASHKFILPAVTQAVNNVLKYATKEGIFLLFKKYVGKEIQKQVAKYIPAIGQVIAASVAFGITYKAGTSYLDDCYILAEDILKEHLE